jgi:hypothetical protein
MVKMSSRAALREWRGIKLLTLEQCAALFGVSKRTFQYWETPRPRQGSADLQLPKLVDLAWLGVRHIYNNDATLKSFKADFNKKRRNTT